MHFTLSISGALGLLSLAFAVPLEKKSFSGPPTSSTTVPSLPEPSSTWHPEIPSSSAPPPGSASHVTLPLANGFPNIQNPSDALSQIYQQAHGTLSNAPPPAKGIGNATLTSLQFLALGETFEVFYFTELLYNVTNNVDGYRFDDEHLRDQVIEVLTVVQAQEELHALNVNFALAKSGQEKIQPCKYMAGVDNFQDAIATAATFTDVVLGALGDVSVVAGTTGDAPLIRGFAATLGQEGEQNGYYRTLLGKVPSALPFLTASTREFAFSAINQKFIVPGKQISFSLHMHILLNFSGSCPNSNLINLPIFGVLNVLTQNIQAQDQQLEFSFKPTNGQTGQGMSVVYINQQLVPIVVPLENPKPGQNGEVVASAFFPYSKFLMNGLTIAALVEGTGVAFSNVTAVAAATKFGPGLIEIN